MYPTDADSASRNMLNNAMSAKQYSKKHKSEYGYQFLRSTMFRNCPIKPPASSRSIYTRPSKTRSGDCWSTSLSSTCSQQKIVGVEALIRWNHPGARRRFALRIYRVRRTTRHDRANRRLGDSNEACRQLRSLARHEEFGDCKIAINLSSVQLIQSDIVQRILEPTSTNAQTCRRACSKSKSPRPS